MDRMLHSQNYLRSFELPTLLAVRHNEPFSAHYLTNLPPTGPDAQDTARINVQNYALTFFASELRLRGDAYIQQPHRGPQGNILCWNGEVCWLSEDLDHL